MAADLMKIGRVMIEMNEWKKKCKRNPKCSRKVYLSIFSFLFLVYLSGFCSLFLKSVFKLRFFFCTLYLADFPELFWRTSHFLRNLLQLLSTTACKKVVQLPRWWQKIRFKKKKILQELLFVFSFQSWYKAKKEICDFKLRCFEPRPFKPVLYFRCLCILSSYSLSIRYHHFLFQRVSLSA